MTVSKKRCRNLVVRARQMASFIISRDALSELFPKADPTTFLAPNEFDMAAVAPARQTP